MPKSIKLLTVGNSFSDNATKYLYPIFKALGYKEVVIGNLYIGGCSIERHVINSRENKNEYVYRKDNSGKIISYYDKTLLDGLLDEKWDYITMQQASHYSGKPETYELLDELYNYIKKNALNKNVKIGWHMTWAYQGDANHPNFPDYNKDQLFMYNRIVNAVKTQILPHKGISFVIPAGTAIQNGRTSYLGDRFTADGFHLDAFGEFVAGLMFAKVLTGGEELDLDLDIIPQDFNRYLSLAIESVENAYCSPYEVTQSELLSDPITRPQNKVNFIKDLKYSNSFEGAKLDLYLPEQENFDIVVMAHGGGLKEGDKLDMWTIAYDVANEGVAVASINYRMYPDYKYPDFLYDAANAIKFIFEYKKEHNIKGRVFFSGNSAGAYIGMMLCFDNKYLNSVGLEPLDIAGFLLESGQPTEHFNILGYNGEDGRLIRVDETSPIYYINEDTKFNKVLLISYTDDIRCRLAQNQMLYETILYFNDSANVELRTLFGTHCRSCCFYVHHHSIYSDIVLDFVRKD